jgi:pyruvate kinase
MNLENYRHTKILATIGPASNTLEQVEKLIEAGADLFRLNFSHGSYEDHANYISTIREASKKKDKPVGILVDLQGPKIRIGEVENNGVELISGNKITITTEECIGTSKKVFTNYETLPFDIRPGENILIDDGLIELKVLKKSRVDVECEVVNGGLLKSRKGINLPYVKLSMPGITDKDLEDLSFAIEKDIDFVALSFVRTEADIHEIRHYMHRKNKDFPVIAKIEKPEAVENIDKIIDASYGIMVARGDLGVEIQVEEVPVIQKEIIDKCNELGKPVIVATQMLDSMIRNPRPTRAEASDVANAVLDGADVVMLSGETASGEHPLRSVKTMSNILLSVEKQFINAEFRKKTIDEYVVENITHAICYSAYNIARTLNAKLLAIITHSGRTARRMAKYRPHLPILAITDDQKVPRKMSIIWGVHCVMINKIERTEECFQEIESKIEESGELNEGDLVVYTAGMPTLEKNSTNMMKVQKIQKQKKNTLF